ncbi:hypothetical protein LTR85_003277 [Meristemomyces frigidus]|nr:hypothetical protein LTR85_003277 [Meristemomyces frigidus]
MWCWDTVMEWVAGSGPAQHLRAHQFHEEVRLAGIAQERRAQSANSMRSSGVTSRCSFSPANTSTASRYSTPVRSYAPNRGGAIFAIPPGSVRPRRIDVAFRHPVHHEVPIPPATVKDVKNRCASVHRVDSAATSRVSTPQDSRTASPGSTRNSVGSSFRSNSPPTDQQAEDPDWVAIGRFRHPTKADPEWVKAKLDDELQGPGAHTFFGPEGKLGVHPLETQYHERRKSAERDDSIQVFTLTPKPEFVPCHERLAQKFRTEPSTTVTPDGCVITKGFVVSPRPSAPPSRVPTPVNSNNTVIVESNRSPQPSSVNRNDTVIVDSNRSPQPSSVNRNDTVIVEPKPNPQPKPQLPKPTRSITWDERTITRFDNADIAEAVHKEAGVSDSSSAATHYGTTPRLRELQKVRKQPKRSNSEDVPRRTEAQNAPDSTWSTESTAEPISRTDAKVKIVSAEEAESAIVSEDEDAVRPETVEEPTFIQQRVVLTPSKRLTPPAKGILKRPSGHTMSTESSEKSTQSDQVLATDINNNNNNQQQIRFAPQRQAAASLRRFLPAEGIKETARTGALRT